MKAAITKQQCMSELEVYNQVCWLQVLHFNVLKATVIEKKDLNDFEKILIIIDRLGQITCKIAQLVGCDLRRRKNHQLLTKH